MPRPLLPPLTPDMAGASLLINKELGCWDLPKIELYVEQADPHWAPLLKKLVWYCGLHRGGDWNTTGGMIGGRLVQQSHSLPTSMEGAHCQANVNKVFIDDHIHFHLLLVDLFPCLKTASAVQALAGKLGKQLSDALLLHSPELCAQVLAQVESARALQAELSRELNVGSTGFATKTTRRRGPGRQPSKVKSSTPSRTLAKTREYKATFNKSAKGITYNTLVAANREAARLQKNRGPVPKRAHRLPPAGVPDDSWQIVLKTTGVRNLYMRKKRK
ncbi:hypothetical protein TeGR_g13455 [Tetraparma gracilis]|uniref:Uncharacterized protein n=1 Tax=Tetraparma gracilis TaxID=2962635 RepID=A0ABQ6NBU6_9STRA|nr:hypothetical protein TeGR_g13455 [Tetraparma gracilis]